MSRTSTGDYSSDSCPRTLNHRCIATLYAKITSLAFLATRCRNTRNHPPFGCTAGQRSPGHRCSGVAATDIHRTLPSTLTMTMTKATTYSRDPGTFGEKAQRERSRLIESAITESLSEGDDVWSKARVLSTSAPFASAWLAPVTADGVMPPFLSDAQFAVLTRMRAGLPVYADSRSSTAASCDTSSRCALCNAMVLDQYGTHALNCLKTGARYRVHTAVVDATRIVVNRGSVFALSRKRDNIAMRQRRSLCSSVAKGLSVVFTHRIVKNQNRFPPIRSCLLLEAGCV